MEVQCFAQRQLDMVNYGRGDSTSKLPIMCSLVNHRALLLVPFYLPLNYFQIKPNQLTYIPLDHFINTVYFDIERTQLLH